MLGALCFCVAPLGAAPAMAQSPSRLAAKQAAGLFMQSCLQYAGDRQGLRDWARRLGLQVLPPQVQLQFLNGQAGAAFDASTKGGKFVLASQDGGACSVVAQAASGPDVIGDLEQDLNEARIPFRLIADKADAEEKALRHREYLVSYGQRDWQVLVSTVRQAAGGQAMLTLGRR